MNPIRKLRAQAGLTQQQLAAAAGTSQSTIAAYESGSKSPTLRTVEHLAGALGLELVAEFVPPMTREDRRSLAFHRAVAERLDQDPEPVIARARKNLIRLTRLHPHAGMLLERWRRWLDMPPGELTSRMLDLGPQARDMRQVSPFSGVLDAAERARVLSCFRREEGL